MAVSPQTSRSFFLAGVVLVTYVLHGLATTQIGMRYRLFHDPFDPLRLLADLGLFVVLFAVVHWALRRFGLGRP